MPLVLSRLTRNASASDLTALLENSPLQLQEDYAPESDADGPHVFGRGFRCNTESRGHETPQGRSPMELVLDNSEGFIPLWDRDVVLRWKIREDSLAGLKDRDRTKATIETLLAQAIMAWGDAVPIRFAQRDDAWDFEIVVQQSDDCVRGACVLASAFFPDAGRHQFNIYPRMFEQSAKEQIETMAHEIGHIFGLRHFFALVKETRWPAVGFRHSEGKKFSIMNYGEFSTLTQDDRVDLRDLYKMVWSGKLSSINGTKIQLVRPYHETASRSASAVAVAVAD